MPEEKELTLLPKKKEKEEIARRIELKHILALGTLAIVTLWIYSSSQEFRTLIQENMIWIVVIAFITFWWLTQKGKVDQPIGMIQAETLCRDWVEYKQRRKEMPEGSFKIEQSKRKAIDEKPKNYYFDVRIQSSPVKSYLISVDSLSGDITMSEPATVTRISKEPEAKDTYLKKRVLKGEVEYEEV